jgi:DNA-binding XRE family transcriptional regulator
MYHDNTPLRKARALLGLTTAEAGQYVHVTRKTWEAWEAKEAAGQPVPAAALELFFAKLDALAKRLREGPDDNPKRELVVVLRRDPVSGADTPADVVSDENYLGNDPDPDSPDFHIIKSLAVDRSGKPYVHRTRYAKAHNQHVLAFCARHTSVAA